ncbi:EAL domain-containing protein [Caloramator sp. mosi_1]|uniref:EAL domain-containing protein n=1 Tax=Caloramator sp. mosi_1 TaxID=3023090 RepID=UPI00235EE78D|nr:EAL domain-containing protein [Caloramator sp. mosi_1]WDC84808.1 EAL domain-containing protein [Caloramator sp. mosi_1]
MLIKIRKAIDNIDNNEFYLVYQPILDLETLKIQKVEALARLKCEKLGYVPPSDFIPLLEQTGLIKEFGYIILEKVFNQIKVWKHKGIELDVNINISPLQLRDKNFISKLNKLREVYEVDLTKITFEITENQMLQCDELQHTILNEIRKMGISLSIDDYGNDYSQMTNLIKIPAKEIKISKEIISSIEKDKKYN